MGSPLETNIEDLFRSYIELNGCRTRKGKGVVGWPDREVYLFNGHMFFIELKRKNKKPRRIQVHKMNELISRGFHVYWTDSYKEAVEVFNWELLYARASPQDRDQAHLGKPVPWPPVETWTRQNWGNTGVLQAFKKA